MVHPISMIAALMGAALVSLVMASPGTADGRGGYLFEKHCGSCHSRGDLEGYAFDDLKSVMGPRTLHAIVADLSDRDLKRIVGYLAAASDD
jgi:mono/diheme cytochrome c family protein